MAIENFTNIYSRKAIIITNNINNSQLINVIYLNDEEMQTIVGMGSAKYNWHKIGSMKKYYKKSVRRYILNWPFTQHRTVYYYTVYYKYR
ncbi:hypothetical protein SDC9_03767 [bioreactor metagenome]|uniref:Uncharacterized protein n=1 Tax=bioreactor metagenome TaxID=1076179 RepID=A0A644SUC1_9ZZZZ|nr:hypothetical protein [Methanobrevibacter sp.]MEA4956375.1 hypothetical protein [Methanobrevibacter sp.]